MLVVCLIAEAVVRLAGGQRKIRNIALGGLVLELCAKAVSFGISWLMLRENPGMLFTVGLFVAIGSIGTFIGLVLGTTFMKELRHAGIISHS